MNAASIWQLSRGLRADAPEGAVALLHPGRADGWWWTGSRAAWHDGEHLFVEDGDVVHVIATSGPVRVAEAGGVLTAWSPSAQWRVHGGQVSASDARRERLGGVTLTRAPGGPWRAEGLDLPEGATRAKDLRPFPTGVGVAWSADGYLYRLSGTGAPEAVTASVDWIVGEHGVLLLGEDESWLRAAAPGRAPIELPCPLADPIRFSPDGARASALDPEGGGVYVDLAAGRILGRREGLPVGDDAWLLPTGDLVAAGRVVRTGIRESSWALAGHLLAGPGGHVWDLRRRAPVGEPGVVQLGGVVATRSGFVTAHWESGAGAHLDFAGRVTGRFSLPLEEDDVVVDAVADGDDAIFGTAMGAGFRVRGEHVAPCDGPEVERPEPPEGWPLAVEAEVTVDGVQFAWATDGTLLAR